MNTYRLFNRQKCVKKCFRRIHTRSAPIFGRFLHVLKRNVNVSKLSVLNRWSIKTEIACGKNRNHRRIFCRTLTLTIAKSNAKISSRNLKLSKKLILLNFSDHYMKNIHFGVFFWPCRVIEQFHQGGFPREILNFWPQVKRSFTKVVIHLPFVI